MLNQIVLVGRVKEMPIIKETSQGNKVATLIMEVERNFKNSAGECEYDNFQVTLWRGMADECEANCSVGAIVGVKGRLQANNYMKDDIIYYKGDIVAEKISVLTKS
ncbi:MAG: single-stranded DNA-binding protein [Erysipelotrichaceae bacterium]